MAADVQPRCSLRPPGAGCSLACSSCGLAMLWKHRCTKPVLVNSTFRFWAYAVAKGKVKTWTNGSACPRKV